MHRARSIATSLPVTLNSCPSSLRLNADRPAFRHSEQNLGRSSDPPLAARPVPHRQDVLPGVAISAWIIRSCHIRTSSSVLMPSGERLC